MNKVFLTGRLSRDPKSFDSGETRIEKFNLGVTRKTNKGEADFIDCTAFGKTADFVSKYLRKGIKISVIGSIRTSNYEKSGLRVYTSEVIVENIEFMDTKEVNLKYNPDFDSPNSSNRYSPSSNNNKYSTPKDKFTNSEGFIQIPDGIEDELPFS